MHLRVKKFHILKAYFTCLAHPFYALPSFRFHFMSNDGKLYISVPTADCRLEVWFLLIPLYFVQSYIQLFMNMYIFSVWQVSFFLFGPLCVFAILKVFGFSVLLSIVWFSHIITLYVLRVLIANFGGILGLAGSSSAVNFTYKLPAITKWE